MQDHRTEAQKSEPHDTDAQPINSPSDLSKFQLRILAVLAAAEDAPKGVTVRRALEAYYDAEVNHGRLYPNLDDLNAAGYVAKGTKDRRTNAYSLTDAGAAALTTEVTWLQTRLDTLEDDA